MTTTYDDPQRELLERLDEGIRSTANVNLMEAAEVQDLLLDLRHLLTKED